MYIFGIKKFIFAIGSFLHDALKDGFMSKEIIVWLMNGDDHFRRDLFIFINSNMCFDKKKITPALPIHKPDNIISLYTKPSF